MVKCICWGCMIPVKFIYSEKASQFEKISRFYLKFLRNVKRDLGWFFQIFESVSEYRNFKRTWTQIKYIIAYLVTISKVLLSTRNKLCWSFVIFGLSHITIEHSQAEVGAFLCGVSRRFYYYASNLSAISLPYGLIVHTITLLCVFWTVFRSELVYRQMNELFSCKMMEYIVLSAVAL